MVHAVIKRKTQSGVQQVQVGNPNRTARSSDTLDRQASSRDPISTRRPTGKNDSRPRHSDKTPVRCFHTAPVVARVREEGEEDEEGHATLSSDECFCPPASPVHGRITMAEVILFHLLCSAFYSPQLLSSCSSARRAGSTQPRATPWELARAGFQPERLRLRCMSQPCRLHSMPSRNPGRCPGLSAPSLSG